MSASFDHCQGSPSYMTRFEIAGAKRISQHLFEPHPSLTRWNLVLKFSLEVILAEQFNCESEGNKKVLASIAMK